MPHESCRSRDERCYRRNRVWHRHSCLCLGKPHGLMSLAAFAKRQRPTARERPKWSTHTPPSLPPAKSELPLGLITKMFPCDFPSPLEIENHVLPPSLLRSTASLLLL